MYKDTLIWWESCSGGKTFEDPFSFFQSLKNFWQSVSVNGPKLCYGDFNSRLYTRLAGEETFIGQHFFQKPSKILRPDMNRFLLLEFCAFGSLCIANTFYDRPVEEMVTYRELATKPKDEITTSAFAELDFLLVEQAWSHKILSIRPCSNIALASHRTTFSFTPKWM